MITKHPLNITVDKEAFKQVKEHLDENMTNTSKYFNFIMLEDLKILKISKKYDLNRDEINSVLCWLRTYLDFHHEEKCEYIFDGIQEFFNLSRKQIDDIHSIWVDWVEEYDEDYFGEDGN